MVVCAGLTEMDPFTGRIGTSSVVTVGEMVTLVAWVEVHANDTGCPLLMVDGLAAIVTVGAAAFTVTVAVAVAVPPAPVAVIV